MVAFAGATWPWLGAALAKTSEIEVRTSVRAPILRYHPAIVAQVFATFEYMFPDMVFLTVGQKKQSTGTNNLLVNLIYYTW